MIYEQCVNLKFNWVNVTLSTRLVPRHKGQGNETKWILAHRSPEKGWQLGKRSCIAPPVPGVGERRFQMTGGLKSERTTINDTLWFKKKSSRYRKTEHKLRTEFEYQSWALDPYRFV